MQMLNRQLADEGQQSQAAQHKPPRQFNLLRWFSVVSLLIIASVAVGLGYVSTRFVVNDSVERDAMLTAQFIQAMAQAEVRHSRIAPGTTMAELLDPRQDSQHSQVSAQVAAATRTEFLDHVDSLPDTLLTNVYALDRTIVWSTNPQLIGQQIEGDADLDESFASKVPVSASYHRADEEREEQKFQREPEYLFIENYLPMFDASGTRVVSMVEIYKEPHDLVRRIQRGYVLIWTSTILGGALIYFGLFWIVRRAASMLRTQETQLVASETFAALGEMSSAVAHSLRNPLANIRSSAELAQDIASAPAQKNIGDIISQVDRMSRWVRDLLVSLRPMNDDAEAVELVAAIDDTRHAFAQQLDRNKVQVQIDTPALAWVVSQPVLLTQILNSLFANALEAMPTGGRLNVAVQVLEDRRQLQLTLSDTGKGMTQQQERMVFKPFFTTKQGGLGVGLVLVKRIMERFGGSVSLASREEEGTRVCLIFNVAAGGDHGTEHPGSRG
ncbi:HAMP domain-containing sensor histidine kinase [Pseudomonas wadenswilerensis]|uniref:histidine kinase n=1 Tax=Pseudomonas wadenswilerensis TaxID=1785161 RepID=A0A380SYX9_9PSED|nr:MULTISPECIES: HAMP domain-containing sensor histidine kinase [Pseudomonas]MCE5980754.1 HAMP domain-containing histidine kinase [Pseudomonas sp. LF19]UVM24319.1 HAMP domain-containing histidine kinase [Pseudomonas wadenswilerensis]SPO66652.1 putative sensor histidine kinase [Pseudomonas sp. JV241A]SUQ62915.1 Sensor protein ZraS [Pseudomonas wadenswilerensis]